MVLAKQQFGRVTHLAQTILSHFINAQFGGASETVLDAAENAVHIMLVTFKLQYGVYNMFQYLGAGNASFFIDMADQNDRRICFFGKF